MRLVLEIVSGPLLGKTVAAEEHQVVRVGRTAKSDFPTNDGFMSGEHFAVEGDANEWRIRDLNSRNGTKVNGKRVVSAALKEGDRIHAGSIDFLVRIETDESVRKAKRKKLLSTLPPAEPPAEIQDREWTKEVPPSIPTNPDAPPATSVKRRIAKPEAVATPAVPKKIEKPAAAPETLKTSPKPPPPPPPARVVKKARVPAPPVSDAMQSYQAVTPGGRLLHLLQTQPVPVMALLDSTNEKKLLDHLSGEDFQSLYQNPANIATTPYLVNLPPDSQFLRKMVYDGWGRGWGIYLTCPVSLAQLREYFRRELMVRLPDGVELFSRFYEPRFFRTFLDSCTAQEAQKFFGPVRSYLIEGEKPEIVLEYTRTESGVEKQGHLLSDL